MISKLQHSSFFSISRAAETMLKKVLANASIKNFINYTFSLYLIIFVSLQVMVLFLELIYLWLKTITTKK